MLLRKSSQRRGFTLNDLLVAVLLTLVLAGVLMAGVGSVRESSARSVCQDNLHNIVDAVHNFSSAHDDKLPPMLDFSPTGKPTRWIPFWYALYEELEQVRLFKQAQGGAGGWDNLNHSAIVKVLLCVSDPTHHNGMCTSGARRWAGTSYAPNYKLFGQETVMDPAKGVFITQSKYRVGQIPDGLSGTVGFVERYTSFKDYGWSNAILYPMDQAYWGLNPYGSAYGAWGLFRPQTKVPPTGMLGAHPYYPNSAHGACQVLMMDGAVKQVTGSVSARTWVLACIPDNGSPGEDW